MLTKMNAGFRRFLRQGRIFPADRGGFTLVEIMVVLLILTVGILPLAMIQSRARREVTESDIYTQAITVAQAQMERIKNLGFGNAVNEEGVDGTIAWSSTITNVAFGLDRVEVNVTYRDGGDQVTMTFADLMSMR